MPAEKITHCGSDRKNEEQSLQAGMEHTDAINKDSSTTVTFHPNTDVNPGNGVTDFDNRVECSFCCGENAESESGQRSCQHWTQVRPSNTRQAQKKKLRGLQNGHPDPSRYTHSRNTKENTDIQRPTFNGNSIDGLSMRNPSETNTSNSAASRFKCDRFSHSSNKNAPSSNAELTKPIASNSSSPAPSVSSDLPNGHDFSDNRTFPRYAHKSSRSFRSSTQANESDDLNSQRSNASPVTVGGANTRNRAPVSRYNVNMSPQSGAIPTAYQNGPFDQWRRPTNNGSLRRSHQQHFVPRNTNQFHRYNGPTTHPGRPHQNNFSRNRVPGSGMGDSPPVQANDSPNPVINEYNPQPDSFREDSKKPQTSWATVAVGVQCEEKPYTPKDNSRDQLVSFLMEQWRRFDRKST
ncbi:unnamed protein product [Schistosoma rodhaini]|uniref:Uncharacterized protein n=1 Tax=Schistosoma rodhaini TaxID=6188 RepID=A0AA85FP54_9TREM|nr:unnamed protein product [Schistosoma rodhaini]